MRRVRGTKRWDRDGLWQVRSATAERTFGQVPEVGARGPRVLNAVAEKDGVSPESGEPTDRCPRVPGDRGDDAWS